MAARPFFAKHAKHNIFFMTKNIFAFTLLFAMSCSLTAPKVDDNKEFQLATKNFVEGTKDIPLAAGLNKISDNELGFDSVNGSITAVSYKSENNLEKVQNFYEKTLPQMGWKTEKHKKRKLGTVNLRRDNEKLEIEFLNQDGDDLVKFFVEVVSK